MNTKLFVFASLLGALGFNAKNLSPLEALLEDGGMQKEDIDLVVKTLKESADKLTLSTDADITFHYTAFVKELVKELKELKGCTDLIKSKTHPQEFYDRLYASYEGWEESDCRPGFGKD